AFLDALEIRRLAVAPLDGPPRAAGEHRVHLGVVEPYPPGAADAGRDVAEKLIRERFLLRLDIGQREPGVPAPDAAGDVEADAAGRDDSSFVRIECRDAADRKPVAPMRIRHRVRRPHDARQRGDVAYLRVALLVHLADERLVAIDDARHAHLAGGVYAPAVLGFALEQIQIHDGFPSDVHDALSEPRAFRRLRDAQARERRALHLDAGRMP